MTAAPALSPLERELAALVGGAEHVRPGTAAEYLVDAAAQTWGLRGRADAVGKGAAVSASREALANERCHDAARVRDDAHAVVKAVRTFVVVGWGCRQHLNGLAVALDSICVRTTLKKLIASLLKGTAGIQNARVSFFKF